MEVAAEVVRMATVAAAPTEAIGQEATAMEATVVEVAATVVPAVVMMAGEEFLTSPSEENALVSHESSSEALAGMAAAAEMVRDSGTEPPSGEVLVCQAAARANPAELEVEASTPTEEAVQRAHAEAPLEGAVVADGGEANSCPPGPKSSGGVVGLSRQVLPSGS